MSRASALAPLILAVGTACARADAPAEPVWGKQPCDECGMLLSDRHFGAQLADGSDRYFFDDVGCMVVFAERRKLPLAHAWVIVADTGEWVDAQSARFAGGAASPMDYGFEARATGDSSWANVRAGSLAKGRKP